MQFHVRGVLLDIEGTTSSIQFVFDVMFPFVRRELERFLQAHWLEPAVGDACRLIARDARRDELAESCGLEASRERVLPVIRHEVLKQMDEDCKTTGLKSLQGLIWQDGFESGELVAHVFDDVPGALSAWKRQELDLRVYSSGSVAAQKLFFGHTVAGDLRPYFSAHYDTTTGSKRESASYRRIVADSGFRSSQILFLSDVVAELDAAHEAGLKTALLRRPGNPAVPDHHPHPTVESFEELELSA